MSQKKKKIRAQFRDAVFERDSYRCRFCNAEAVTLDAHHITDRTLMPFGGYVVSNGISLCSICHQNAEMFHSSNGATWAENMHPNDLYALIESSSEKALEDSYRLLKNT